MRIAYRFLIAALTLVPVILVAQTAGEPAGIDDTVQPPNAIGADDLLAVNVYDAPELSRRVRVEKDGSIRLPLLPDSIEAAGLRPEALETKIAKAFRNGGILVHPSVSVSVLQYASRPISVTGAVHHPITFDASGKVTLLNAITRAEGLTPEAGPDIMVTRFDEERGTPVTQTIVVKDLMDGNHLNLNLVLEGGEEIRVSTAPLVYVLGNVRKPGSYAVQDSADLTVLKVVALAGGELPYTAKEAYIQRLGPDGKNKVNIPFDLRSMMDRKTPDMPLQANDLVYITDNKGKRAALTTLDRLAGFGSQTASGLIIFR